MSVCECVCVRVYAAGLDGEGVGLHAVAGVLLQLLEQLDRLVQRLLHLQACERERRKGKGGGMCV